MQIVTKSGFKCRINKDIINSYAFLKMIAKLDKNPISVVDLVTMLLGDQEDKLMKHLGGNPSVEEVSNEVSDIIEQLKNNDDIKN